MNRRQIVSMVMAMAATPTLWAGDAYATGPQENERVARAYMDAYSRADWDGMARYMAEDFVFQDRSNPDTSFPARFEGRAAAVSMLKAFGRDGGIVELGFEFPTVFASKDVVVFSGYVNTINVPPGKTEALKWRARQVTVLTLRNGEIVLHEDFADYPGAVISRVEPPSR
jgi:ketosteroid isomerase-like protein